MGSAAAHRRRGRRRALWWGLAAVAAIAVVLGVVVSSGMLHDGGGTASASPSSTPATHHVVEPLTVVGTTPSAGATNVDPGATITVSFSTPLGPNSPMPSLNPPLAGSWSPVSGGELQFVATATPVPGTQETLTIPGGPSGVISADGQTLAQTTTVGFTLASGSELRLQQLLAQLGYLPLAFTPTGSVGPQEQADPQPGDFSWRWANQPASLTSLWTEGSDNVITRGAVMNFQSQHNLATDGVAGPQVWSALLQAVSAGDTDKQPYGYVYVSKNIPESVTVYQNGSVAYTTPANTGVPQAPTDSGTFPVYLRYDVTTMSGTNPDGSHYNDPGIPWVSYFNGGDALHGFVRDSYGTPQSVGCVEMPIANAAVVYPMTPIGTLVTVQ